MLKNSVTKTIGNTPLLRMTRLKKSLGLKSDIFAKLEFLNPAGSIKDRVAEEIIASAIREGKINAKTTVIEATSGNTGIGLAFCCACRGLKLIVVMPDTMSGERISLMKAYGAEVVLSQGKLGMRGAVEEAERIAASSDNAFLARQFENPANAAAHFKTTGPEIYRDLSNTDYFVAGIGTGGTITGAGGFLKKKLKDVRLVGVEPAASPVLTEGKSGSHRIQGIGAGLVPPLLKKELLYDIVTVSDEDAIYFAKLVASTEGCCVGISAGANVCACVKLAQMERGKNIVTVLPDSGARYISTGLFG